MKHVCAQNRTANFGREVFASTHGLLNTSRDSKTVERCQQKIQNRTSRDNSILRTCSRPASGAFQAAGCTSPVTMFMVSPWVAYETSTLDTDQPLGVCMTWAVLTS